MSTSGTDAQQPGGFGGAVAAPGTNGGLSLLPFRGLRYVPQKVGSLAAVTSPPYDVVVHPEGLHHLETADPHNFVRLILPHADTDPQTSHRLAADTLCRWQADGVLAADPVPALYVYEQQDSEQVQRGLIGALRLSAPEEGLVLPHEDVMPALVADRAALMRATAANLEPLLLTYQGHGGAAEVVERATRREPLLTTTTEGGVQHRLWSVTSAADIAAVSADLTTCQALIADGHHRWATYLRLQHEHGDTRGAEKRPSPWDYGLVLLVDSIRYPLRMRAIHRVLYHLPVATALTALGGACQVEEVSGPLENALSVLADAAAGGNAFLLAGDGNLRLLTKPDPRLVNASIPQDRPALWRGLDTVVLHRLLIGRIWQVPDSPEHIGYLHDAAAAVQQAERVGGTAVLMHPVSESLVRTLAEQGVTMPRKSTSFGPKPASGLVLRSLRLS